MGTGNLLIDRTTTIKQLLEVDEEGVINTLVALNKNFRKLKNPLLRKIFAKRVSVEDACKIAGCSIHEFMHTMEAIGFKLATPATEEQGSTVTDRDFCPVPERTIELDVRPILAGGKDPLKAILNELNALKDGFTLKIINTFEPLPLIHLLSQKGYAAHTVIHSKNYVETCFFRSSDDQPIKLPLQQAAEQEVDFDEMRTRFEGNIRVVDVRGLEMPGPMVTILDTLDTLREGEALFVHHKKKPVYLLPHLHHKGFDYLLVEKEENEVKMLIYKS